MQTVPISKIPDYITSGLDIIIRRAVKSIIGLPASTCSNMFYAPRKYRGLGLICTQWEAKLQHFSIAKKLLAYNDVLFHRIYDCEAEMHSCRTSLRVDGETTRQLRQNLRTEEFNKWCSRPWQGFGAIHFKTYTPANNFVCNKNSLSSSEWSAAIKLNCNYANVNGVPGNNCSSDRCRRCGSEKETPAHIIGSCKNNSLLITARHHRIKKYISELLQDKGFDCYDEVFAVDNTGKRRFSDIVAFDRKSSMAFIIDPTVRYESNNENQDKEICAEKQNIYNQCIDFYEHRFAEKYGHRQWNVIGLWFGARGTINSSVLNFFCRFNLNKGDLLKLSESVLIDSLHIIHNHIYKN